MTSMADSSATLHGRRIALALQGGGSHGAYTWGVLDRILEEATLDIAGITGTSAGAMNAVVLADGLVRGGAEGARRNLRTFWETIGRMPGFASFLGPMAGETAAKVRLEYTPVYVWWDMVSRNLSPYDLNPARFNPLRGPLERMIDFDRLRAQDSIQIMVGATNARTARRRVFTNPEISVDAVLASACLPQLFPAVEIDGEPYWDGGYTGNPALAALIRKVPDCDVIISRVDPAVRDTLPRSVGDIQDRVREISFNSAFWLEMSALSIILKLVDEGILSGELYGRSRFHIIEASLEMEKLASSSKLNTYPAFIEYLFVLGRGAADRWLAENGTKIGRESTLDFRQLLPIGA
jgi:NTE family protein